MEKSDSEREYDLYSMIQESFRLINDCEYLLNHHSGVCVSQRM